MSTLFICIVIGTSLWMAFDAHQIGYDKKDVKGMAGMGPLGWLFAGLLLWIIAFPLYLASRSKLKEAAAQKNGHGTSTGESAVAADAGSESEKKDLSSRIGRGFVNGVYVLGALAVAIPLLIWISSDKDETVPGQPASSSEIVAVPQPERTTATSQSGSADPEVASMAAKIRADTSPLAVQVKRFCAGKGDECLVDQARAAFEVNDLMQAYAAGSPEYTVLSSCADRFGNSDGGGDYVRIKRCATGDMVARESSGNENLMCNEEPGHIVELFATMERQKGRTESSECLTKNKDTFASVVTSICGQGGTAEQISHGIAKKYIDLGNQGTCVFTMKSS